MISIVYCTKSSKSEHTEHLIKTSGLHKKTEVIEIINNGESLTKAYNRGLKQAKNDIVVFCHDDIQLETKQWGKKLLKHFDNTEFGIIGVAGSKYMPVSGKWWEKPKSMYGKVKHTHQGKSWLSEYSPSLENNIEQTVIVDGLFFAIDKNRLKKDFDETVEGFHFYDVDFCFRNHIEGVKVGVITNIRVNHFSIGQTNEQWEENRKLFSEKYKDSLPVRIDETFENRRMKVLLACLNFRSLTGSEISTFELAKSLKNNGCDVSICSNIGEPLASMAKREGIKLFSIQEPPSYKLGDGEWGMNTPKGIIKSVPKKLYRVGALDYDVIQVNHKPISDMFMKLYPEQKFINIVRSSFLELEDPIITDRVTKYVAINEPVKNHLMNDFDIEEDDIELIYNIVNVKNTGKNINEFPKPDKKLYIFAGTMNYLRRTSVNDAVTYTKDKGELWLIGHDNDFGYAKELANKNEHVKYIGVQKNMPYFYDIADATFGLYLGRTLIEGMVSGKECIGYYINKNGDIIKRDDVTNLHDKELFSEDAIINQYLSMYKTHFNNK